DLVHLACLARAWSAASVGGGGEALPETTRAALADRLLTLRRDDGGWAMTPETEASTSYGTFLGVGAFQDLGLPVGRPSEAAAFLDSTATVDGGYALEVTDGSATAVATVPTTAAAVVALRQLGGRAEPASADWLLRHRHPQGGFVATAGAPMPDLLSTAVGLHALSVLEADLGEMVEPLLDFVDTLWTARGAFYGQWADEEVDVEYTFYGLLTLGHLAVYENGGSGA
ncbi:MAG: terpene cyclase/mutase family protein, partial [Holophagales bacterium]|nr:terpene cyclase/mutase family protein [Holophagales bacterium]